MMVSMQISPKDPADARIPPPCGMAREYVQFSRKPPPSTQRDVTVWFAASLSARETSRLVGSPPQYVSNLGVH